MNLRKKWGTGTSSNIINIPNESILKDVAKVKIRKVYKTLGELYAKKEVSDTESKIVTGYDGRLTYFRPYTKPTHNDNIIAIIEASGFGMTAQDLRMTRLALYHNRGSIVRTHNYDKQVILFVAKNFPLNNWFEKELLFTTSDKGKEYEQDSNLIRKSILWTCTSPRNHCMSFFDSEGNLYKNEMCLDYNSLVRKELVLEEKFGALDPADKMLLGVFDDLFELSKRTEEYDEKLTYGTYQISEEINIFYIDSNQKKVFKNEKVNTKLKELKVILKEYYDEQLRDLILKYELVK